MAGFQIGDLVVMTSGSMRMAVEAVNDSKISTVWCQDGVIGRDTFDARLLRKWEETRNDDRSGPPRGRPPHKGERDGGRGDDRGAPRGKPGWDGKPREKKFFRKD